MKKRFSWLLLPASVLALDLLSKLWIVRTLTEDESLVVIPGFFHLTLGFNRGAIFGTLTWLPATARFVLFFVAGLAALLFFGRHFLSEQTPTWERVPLGFILGGALGNGIDRLARGAVVDFLDFIFGHWHYWAFNLADSFILVGAILLGLGWLLAPKDSQPANEN
jgi:signal peptidase II